jgi:hypothetical protein
MSSGTRSRPARISAGRAQDWIVTVINPIIDLARRETEAAGTAWRWLPTSRRFEWFAPIRETVSGLYLDNYEDFLAKNPRWAGPIDEHDRRFDALTAAVGAAFDRVMMDGDLRPRIADELVQDGHRAEDTKWYAAAFAAGHQTLSADHGIAATFERTSALRTELARRVAPELERRDAARAALVESSRRLLDDLKSERTALADRHGARIRPIET